VCLCGIFILVFWFCQFEKGIIAWELCLSSLSKFLFGYLHSMCVVQVRVGEVGASSGVDCASLSQCLGLRGFVNCWCLLFLSLILVSK
jgi:hypothetical protein